MDRSLGRLPNDEDWQVFEARAASPLTYGVISTGIFCRSGCPARTPFRRNLRLFESPELAVSAGYRACLRCKPLTLR